jgi:hypothetical protein
MSQPNLFACESYTAYLRQHFLAERSPTFTYGAWATRLGLANTASLTRILAGERQAGDRIVESLIDYFKFNQSEAEYFRLLVRVEKEQDPLVKDLLRTQLKHLRKARGLDFKSAGQGPLVTLKAQLVLLWGHARPDTLDKYLDQFNLRSNTILGFGKALVCLKGAIVYESELGPYLEFNFACHVVKKRNPFSMMNMFFDFLHSPDPEVCASWQRHGSPYAPEGVQVRFTTPWDCGVRLHRANGSELSFAMGRSTRETSSNSENYSIQAYNALLGRNYSFKIDMDSTSCQRDFDPTVDALAWSTDCPLGKLLETIEFKPTRWNTHPRFDARVHSPSPR